MTMLCLCCMSERTEGAPCPSCGSDGDVSSAPHQLPPGYRLNGRYVIGRVLGQGGFGITYIGFDTLLDQRVAVKEYFPTGLANRTVDDTFALVTGTADSDRRIDEGKARFLREARVLVRMAKAPGVVDCYDFFEANNTAYIVMEYLQGRDLRTRLRESLLSAQETFSLMEPVMDALETVHAEGIVHRDISPDNIMLLEDGSLKLMDFGAARALAVDDRRSVSVMLKEGYAPEEQYRSKGSLGPWTDVYALCATMYKCITGITPDNALQRGFEDALRWPSELGFPITRTQEDALRKGMAFRQADRFQTVGEMRGFLSEDAGEPAAASWGDEPTSLLDDPPTELMDEGPTAVVAAPAAGAGRKPGEADSADAEATGSGRPAGSDPSPDGPSSVPAPPKEKRKGKAPLVPIIAAILVVVVGIAAFTMTRGEPPVEVEATGYEGVYDGEKHFVEVSLAEGSADATIYLSPQRPQTYEMYEEYKNGKGRASDFLITAPTFPGMTDAGTMTVYYLAVPERGASAKTCVEGSVDIVITKADQSISLKKNSFSVKEGEKAFSLGAKAQGKLSYASSDEGVAKVDAKGKVIVVGTGKATVTVTAAETDNYKASTAKATITVESVKSAPFQSSSRSSYSGSNKKPGYSSSKKSSKPADRVGIL